MNPTMDSASWDLRYAGNDLLWTAEPNRFLVSEAADLAPGRAIDLGCGEGRNAIWLAERGWEAVGVDFSEAGLRKALDLADLRGVSVRWVTADLLDYRPAPLAFDLVLIFYLQVPVTQRRTILQAAARSLAPGGTFLLVAHDSSNLNDGHGGPQNPAVLYTAQDVIEDLHGAGLQIERAERVERPVKTPDGERVALDALVRARRPDLYARNARMAETPDLAPAKHSGPAMAALTADALVEPWFSCLTDQLPDLRIFDCHTHLGCADPDGSCFDVDELLGALEIVDGRAVVFPLAEPGSYGAANDRTLAAADAAGGRLVPFCRVDPRDGALKEVQRAVGLGAAGIKLHPRAERFGLRDPAVREIVAFADEQRLPIIVHAGRGIRSLGRDALELAHEFPHAPVILAHLAISDLAWIWREAAGQRNLFFDTAWWNTADQLALFTLIPPGQILFASDTPYGRTVAAASLVLRVALAAGLSAEQIQGVAGGQLERLLTGAEPHDLGRAPMTPVPSPGPLLERVHALLIAAAARLTAGYPADEYLELARLACELPADHPDTAAAASVRELLDRHAAHLATDPPHRGPRIPGIHLIFVAAAIARTPGLPLPDPEMLANGPCDTIERLAL